MPNMNVHHSDRICRPQCAECLFRRMVLADDQQAMSPVLRVGREQPDDPGSYPLTGATAATCVRDLRDRLHASSLPVADRTRNTHCRDTTAPVPADLVRLEIGSTNVAARTQISQFCTRPQRADVPPYDTNAYANGTSLLLICSA